MTSLIAASVACLAGAAWAADPNKPFVDVTAASGVDAVVDAGYATGPKWWLSGIDLVDLDGDGNLDLFLSTHGGGPAVAALNDGKGKFTLVRGAALPTTEIHVGYDINEDGRIDLQMTHLDGGGKWWHNRSAPGKAGFKATGMDLGGGQARQNALIDIDRDGKVDWLHEAGRGDVTFDKGDGNGTFVPTKKVLLSTGWKDGPSMLPVDLNGDGHIDLIVSLRGYEEEKTGRSRIYLNDAKKGGEVRFTESTRACGLQEDGLQIMGVGDFNADGATDLVCLEGGKSVAVYLNDGIGKFTRLEGAIRGMEEAAKPGNANWGLAVTVDIDNDGIPDVLMNGREFLYVLRGTGGGHFTYMNRVWGIDDVSKAAVDAGLCFGDIDGDGRLDILGYKAQPKWDDPARVKVYHSQLPPQNWVRIRPIGAAGNKGAAGAKIRVYEAGGLDDAKRLIAYEQVGIYGRQVVHSYYGYAQTERHFGLGRRASVDMSVEFYPSGKKADARGVKANGTAIRIVED